MHGIGTKLAATGAGLCIPGGALPELAMVSEEMGYVLNTSSFDFYRQPGDVDDQRLRYARIGPRGSKNTAATCLKDIALYSLGGLLFYLVGCRLIDTDVVVGITGSPASSSSPHSPNHLRSIIPEMVCRKYRTTISGLKPC